MEDNNTWIDDTWIDDTWIMACDVPLFPPNSPSMTRGKCWSRNNIKKRRRTYGGASFHGDQGNSVGPTTRVTSGDSISVTSGDSASVTSGDSASVTSGDSTSVTSGDSTSVTSGDSTSVTSGDSASVTSGDSASVTSGDSTSVTSGDSTGGDQSAAMTIQEFKRQARNRREQQRSVLISTQMMKLGEVVREANVVPLPPRPKKIEVLTSAIDTIRALQAQIQTQEGDMPAVVCG